MNESDCRTQQFLMLDRDGVITPEKGYLSDPDDVELLPDVADALIRVQELGLGAVVVTNQSGVGRGYFSEGQLLNVHERMAELLHDRGIELDGIYYCPHAPDAGCHCRKPAPGMVLRAAAEHGFRPEDGFVVGDRRTDIQLGQAVGAITFLTTQGYGKRFLDDPETRPDYVVNGLLEAVRIIERLSAQ